MEDEKLIQVKTNPETREETTAITREVVGEVYVATLVLAKGDVKAVRRYTRRQYMYTFPTSNMCYFYHLYMI